MKKSLMLLLIFSSFYVNVNGQLPSYVPTNGLVGYWPFNGNANDVSTNSKHGIVDGPILTSDRFGNMNCAYNFSNVADKIILNNLISVNLLKYTISGWFKKTTSSNNNEGTIFCGSHPCYGPGGLRFSIGGNNQATFGAEFQNCSSVWTYTNNQNYADDSWHFFTATFDGEVGLINSTMLKIYVDNVFISQGGLTQGDVNNVIAPINNSILAIIGNVYNGDDNFQGKLDEIGIWDRVLTQQEIAILYNSTSTGIIETKSILIHVSPNPTYQSIHIDGLYTEMDNSAMIYSIQGQLLKSIPTIENEEIDLSDLDPGVYLIKINDVAHRVVKL